MGRQFGEYLLVEQFSRENLLNTNLKDQHLGGQKCFEAGEVERLQMPAFDEIRESLPQVNLPDILELFPQ